MTTTGIGFPFAVDALGSIAPIPDDDAELRGKIIQVLFAAAAEFTVGQALTRWLGTELVVSAVEVTPTDETITIEVVYLRRADLARRSVRIQFS
jgi:hypothetical protein